MAETLLLGNDFALRLVELGYVSQDAYDRGLIQSIHIGVSGRSSFVTVDVRMLAETDLKELPEVSK